MAKGDMQGGMSGIGGMKQNSPYSGDTQQAPQLGMGGFQQAPGQGNPFAAMFGRMQGVQGTPQSSIAPQGGFGGLMGGIGQAASGMGSAMGSMRPNVMPQQQLPPQAAQPAQDNFMSRYGSMMGGNTGFLGGMFGRSPMMQDNNSGFYNTGISGGMNPGQVNLQQAPSGIGFGGGMGNMFRSMRGF